MAAKVIYMQNGSDPMRITWPNQGPNSEKYTFVSGVAVITPLIAYGDGSLRYPDGRVFPAMTPAGSTFGHQK